MQSFPQGTGLMLVPLYVHDVRAEGGEEDWAGRFGCSWSQSKLGQCFQGFLTADSIALSPDGFTHQIFCVMSSLGVEVWGVLRRPFTSSLAVLLQQEMAIHPTRSSSPGWTMLTKVPVRWWVNAASPFCESGNQNAEVTWPKSREAQMWVRPFWTWLIGHHSRLSGVCSFLWHGQGLCCQMCYSCVALRFVLSATGDSRTTLPFWQYVWFFYGNRVCYTKWFLHLLWGYQRI